MERLTRIVNEVVVYAGDGSYETGSIVGEMSNDQIRNVLRRLFEYEQTGLEPEQVEALKLSIMGKAITEIKEFDGLPVERLKELAQADKEGRVVVLPCKVGDAVYFAYENKVIKTRCEAMRHEEGRTRMICYIPETAGNGPLGCWTGDIGEEAFLTREEAEMALVERRMVDG